MLVHQGHVAAILLHFVLVHWSGSYTLIECLVSDVATVAYISHSFEIVGCDSLVLILTLVLGAETKQWPVLWWFAKNKVIVD